MTMSATAVITGVGLAVPALHDVTDLLRPPGGRLPCGFDPATGLSGREMRHKDRASRYALRAVEPALRDAGLLTDAGFGGPGAGTAVVVSSNLGNLDSVCAFADTIARETVEALSPLGLPHTSSNSIAGWVAIQYGLRGPNVTVCNGSTSGLDALYWARNLIAARRATVAVVVGVEPDTEVASRLLAGGDGCGEPWPGGAAAVVVESAGHARARGARVRATLSAYAREADLPAAVAAVLRRSRAGQRAGDEPIGLWLAAESAPGGAPQPWVESPAPATTLDLTAALGRCSGALGVLQCAAGVAYLDSGQGDAVLATAGGAVDDDGAAALLLSDAGAAA
jgi:3-oxoacyl-[acyl-carrier-protein] synthase II